MSEGVRFIVGCDGHTVAKVDFEGRTLCFDLGVVPEIPTREATGFDPKAGFVANLKRGFALGRGK